MTSEGSVGDFMRWTKRVVAEGPVAGVSKGWTERRSETPQPSVEAMVKLLSEENLALLRLIVDREPGSLRELAELAHRKESNLSRTLRKLREAGIVGFVEGPGRQRAPRVTARRVTLDLDLIGAGSMVRVELTSGV